MPNKKASILLATYNPRIDWFELLLDSLNNQDYDNYDLVILDDCSPNISLEQIDSILKKHVTNIDYHLFKNDTNLGSNKTFEKLLSLTDSEYIAFCDQDDVWHTNKLSYSMKKLDSSGKKSCCSDVRVIDGDGELKSGSITSYLKRFAFPEEDYLNYLIYKNFVIGCTVVAKRDFVLESTPFFKTMVHDHIFAIHAAINNELLIIKEPLIDYRIHGSNQTSTFNNVIDRESYYKNRILTFKSNMDEFVSRYGEEPFKQTLVWLDARIANYKKEKKSFKKLWKLRKINKSISMFELFALRNRLVFNLALKLLKGNKL